MRAYITSRQPYDVAREVERWRERGCRSFVLRRVSDGGQIDQERMGAARYAAGIQSQVELEGASSGLGEPGSGGLAASR